MPRRSSKKPADLPAIPPGGEGLAVPAEEVPAAGKNPAAVALGKLGGRKGGLARAANLSAKKRKEIAKKAAQARWSKGQEEGG